MRLAIRFLGLDLLTIEASTDDETCSEDHPDLASDIVYAEQHAIGFSLPSTTEYDDDDDE